MKLRTTSMVLLGVLASLAVTANAQAPREDVIWARTTAESITLDGVLNEASWAAASFWVPPHTRPTAPEAWTTRWTGRPSASAEASQWEMNPAVSGSPNASARAR